MKNKYINKKKLPLIVGVIFLMLVVYIFIEPLLAIIYSFGILKAESGLGWFIGILYTPFFWLERNSDFFRHLVRYIKDIYEFFGL